MSGQNEKVQSGLLFNTHTVPLMAESAEKKQQQKQKSSNTKNKLGHAYSHVNIFVILVCLKPDKP